MDYSRQRYLPECVEVTGIVLTKLDGSAKGGVALAIEAELGIPIKWVGTGESESDFAPLMLRAISRGCCRNSDLTKKGFLSRS